MQDNDDVSYLLNVADRQVQQMNRLVNDLLDTSRIKRGKLVIGPTRSTIANIVADAVAVVRDDTNSGSSTLR